jgi:hypothetical protein
VGLSGSKSSAVGCLKRLAGGLLRSDLEGVEAVVVLDGALNSGAGSGAAADVSGSGWLSGGDDAGNDVWR